MDPVLQKIVVVGRPIVSCVEKAFELGVGDRIVIDVERLDLKGLVVCPPRRIFPGILHV